MEFVCSQTEERRLRAQILLKDSYVTDMNRTPFRPLAEFGISSSSAAFWRSERRSLSGGAPSCTPPRPEQTAEERGFIKLNKIINKKRSSSSPLALYPIRIYVTPYLLGSFSNFKLLIKEFPIETRSHLFFLIEQPLLCPLGLISKK